jgi:hypothetical protein
LVEEHVGSEEFSMNYRQWKTEKPLDDPVVILGNKINLSRRAFID